MLSESCSFNDPPVKSIHWLIGREWVWIRSGGKKCFLVLNMNVMVWRFLYFFFSFEHVHNIDWCTDNVENWLPVKNLAVLDFCLSCSDTFYNNKKKEFHKFSMIIFDCVIFTNVWKLFRTTLVVYRMSPSTTKSIEWYLIPLVVNRHYWKSDLVGPGHLPQLMDLSRAGASPILSCPVLSYSSLFMLISLILPHPCWSYSIWTYSKSVLNCAFYFIPPS